MEQAIISGVAHDRSEAKITIVGVPDRVGEAARIFEAVAATEINIDMIVQNVSAVETVTDRHLLHPAEVRRAGRDRDASTRSRTPSVSPTSCTTTRSARCPWSASACAPTPGVTAKFFSALAAAEVNIEMISTSEIRISVVVDQDDVDRAVVAAHTAFGLDATEEAVVYAGTGR